MAEFIDTHCHLAHRRLAGHTQAVLDRAMRAGVAALISASGNLAESHRAQQFAREHDNVYRVVPE